MSLFTITPTACGATVDGVEWKLAFDMAAVSHFEISTGGQSFFDGTDHVGAISRSEENPKFRLLGHLVAAGLLREHGPVDHALAMRIAMPLLPALTAAILEAIPALRVGDGDEGEGDDSENPSALASDANDGISTI